MSVYQSRDGGLTWRNVEIRKKTDPASRAASLTLIARASEFIVPTENGVWKGKFTDTKWKLLGTYRPTLVAKPGSVEATVLAHGGSLVSTDITLQALEDRSVKLSEFTVRSDEAGWLDVVPPMPGYRTIYTRLEAGDSTPGAYKTFIHVSAADALNNLDIPVSLTVTDEVRQPFVILGPPLPRTQRASSVTVDPQGNVVYSTSSRVFRLEPDGSATLLAGNGVKGNGGDGGGSCPRSARFYGNRRPLPFLCSPLHIRDLRSCG
jgi:hypothetical protein